MHTAGRNKEHADEDKLKITVFNDTSKARQDKTKQGRAGRAGQGTQEHWGVTSRPDKKELNRQELNTQDN